MRVIRNREPGGERVLALGTFDGVHLGHRKLLEVGREYAGRRGILLRACSFDRHPLEILCPEKAPRLLSTLREKTLLMARYGADELQLIPFTRETANVEPEEFLRMLRQRVTLRAVTAGWNYTFGRGGKGNAQMLLEDGRTYGYEVLIVPPVKTAAGEIVSSTAIRARLQSGDVEGAESMLGHPYELSGRVEQGKQLGRLIGVPTANVQIDSSKQLPAFGVYPCLMNAGGEERLAAVNIGMQPTLPSGKVTVEAHVLDGNPELYGQHVRLRPGNRIRPEKKFGSVEELTEQIQRDTEAVRKWRRMA